MTASRLGGVKISMTGVDCAVAAVVIVVGLVLTPPCLLDRCNAPSKCEVLTSIKRRKNQIPTGCFLSTPFSSARKVVPIQGQMCYGFKRAVFLEETFQLPSCLSQSEESKVVPIQEQIWYSFNRHGLFL